MPAHGDFVLLHPPAKKPGLPVKRTVSGVTITAAGPAIVGDIGHGGKGFKQPKTRGALGEDRCPKDGQWPEILQQALKRGELRLAPHVALPAFGDRLGGQAESRFGDQ